MAWFKMIVMRNAGHREMAGFGVTDSEDPFTIDDIFLVKHEADAGSFDFDPDAMNAFQVRMKDEFGLEPDQCMRIVVHTHPGQSATPSTVDWKNFGEELANQDWSIQLIFGKGNPDGQTTPEIDATLRVRTLPAFHQESNQAPIWVDVQMRIFVEALKGEKQAYLTLNDAPPDLLLKLPIEAWMEEYKENCLPYKTKGNYYAGYSAGGNGYTSPGPGGNVYGPYSPKRAQRLFKDEELRGVRFPEKVTADWDQVQDRYGLNTQELAQLVALDPVEQEKALEALEDVFMNTEGVFKRE